MGRVASAPAQDLDCHHSVISDWGRGITARENMYIVSIPSLFDPSLAPPGKHVVRIDPLNNIIVSLGKHAVCAWRCWLCVRTTINKSISENKTLKP